MVTMGKPTHRETNSQLTHFLFRKLSAQIGCKLSCLKSLAKQAQARAIKVQHLRSLATLTHKHKQIASRDIALHRSFDKSFLQIETTSSRLKPTTHVPAGPFIESEPPSCVGRSLTTWTCRSWLGFALLSHPYIVLEQSPSSRLIVSIDWPSARA